MKKIVVCGLGYVGLVHLAGCWMSARDNSAGNYMFIGYDPDKSKVDKIMSGECPIVEPGLPEVLNDALKDPDHFGVCSDPACWYEDPDVDMVFCCVGTPMSADNSANMRYVMELAGAFGKHIGNKNAIFINKSTSPAGTCKKIYDIILLFYFKFSYFKKYFWITVLPLLSPAVINLKDFAYHTLPSRF